MQTRHGFWDRLSVGILLLSACACLRTAAGGGDANPGATAPTFAPSFYKTFETWKLACEQLPSNRAIDHKLPPLDKLPLKSFAQFEETLDAFLDLSQRGILGQTNAWIDWSPAHPQFFDTSKVYFDKRASSQSIPFQPYAMKLALPSNAEVIFHGDLHGDVHSLVTSLDWLNANQFLDGFRLTRSNLHLVFLGDYTDRGMQGVEVLYTLYRLKLANPDQVFLARGNHEDVSLSQSYGFLAEGFGKYQRTFDPVKVFRACDFLPVVIYLGTGTNFIQCNHGGMEPGYDPGALLDAPGTQRFQMLGTLNRAKFLRQNPEWLAGFNSREKAAVANQFNDFRPESPALPMTLGFMWSDFSILRGQPQLAYDANRLGVVYGDLATKRLLEIASTPRNRVRAVFRAHQQSTILNPMMRRLKAGLGVFRHWQQEDGLALVDADESGIRSVVEATVERPVPDGSVWTFNVSPDSHYGEGSNYNFDTMGILKLAERFEDWKLRVVNVVVVQP